MSMKDILTLACLYTFCAATAISNSFRNCELSNDCNYIGRLVLSTIDELGRKNLSDKSLYLTSEILDNLANIKPLSLSNKLEYKGLQSIWLRRKKKYKKTMLCIHGGGYVCGSASLYNTLEMYHFLLEVENMNILLVTYPKLPFKFSTRKNYVISLVKHLHLISPDNDLYIIGDSAGVHLATFVTNEFVNVDKNDKYHNLIKGLFMISPWCMSDYSINSKENEKVVDFVNADIAKQVCVMNDKVEKNQSILNLQYKNFPEIFLYFGSKEFFSDEIKLLRNKMKCTSREYDGCHIFVLMMRKHSLLAENFCNKINNDVRNTIQKYKNIL